MLRLAPGGGLLMAGVLAATLLAGYGTAMALGGAAVDSTSAAGRQFSLEPDAETVVLTTPQRTGMGFGWGPPDGAVGVLRSGTSYTFFAAARASDACTGAPRAQGTQRLTGTLMHVDGTPGCVAVVHPGKDPNGYSFDRDYAGGGPVLPITGVAGQAALLHLYHGEWQSGRCGSTSCFYAALGLAISVDAGESFVKLGEIVQPTVTRAAMMAAARRVDVGGGTLVVADEQGRHITDLVRADPATTFLYVFYADLDFSNTVRPCDVAVCIAVARAPLRDVIAAAFAGDTRRFPGLFKKFYRGAFTEPATSLDADAAREAGHYTPVIPEVGLFASVIYDEVIGQYLIAYAVGHQRVVFRSGADLLHWSLPIVGSGVSAEGHNIVYPTLIGDGADPMTGGSAPWLIYVKATSWPEWSSATVVGRRLRIGIRP